VEELPIPDVLRDFVIRRRGIVELYPPQVEIVKAGLFEGKNILMSTATATGKTLMAELAMVNAVLTRDSKAVMTVPLRALAYEKARDMSMYEELGIRVAVTTGEYDEADSWLSDYDIIITTYEKFDSLLRHRPPWLGSVGVLFIDEVHFVGDPKRGPIIESIVAKVKSLRLSTQIIASSATVGNAEELAKWLNAVPVVSPWRPVRLREGVYYDGVIYYGDGEARALSNMGDPITSLVIDSLREDGQVLVFTNSRANTLKLAKQLANQICDSSLKLINPETLHLLAEEAAESSPSRILGDELRRTVDCGVAFHHAGLDMGTRRLLEDAFRNRLLKVMVSTTTLAAGVNLPARRVVIHEHRRYEAGVGMEYLPVMEYKQMAGRAGRPGLDPYGEAILVARDADEVDFLMENYVRSNAEAVRSMFFSERNLATQALSAVASGYSSSMNDLLSFVRNTLGYTQVGRRLRIREKLGMVVKFLVESGMLETREEELRATELGSLVNSLYLDPYTASIYVRGLSSRVRTSDFGYIHLIIQSPEVPKLRLRRGEFDDYLMKLMDRWDELLIKPPVDRDEVEELAEEELETNLSFIKTTQMLMDWANEVPEDELLKVYDVGPGDLRIYGDLMDWLVHSCAQLAHHLGAREHASRLEVLRWRLTYGARDELLELIINLEGVGRARARVLYNAGLRTVEDVANADVARISRLRGFGERLATRIIEQARMLVKEGRVRRVESWLRRSGDSMLDYI